MNPKLSKRYNPLQTEDKIYRFWEKGGFFVGKIVKNKKPFVITLPPPNLTGGLHAGHALCLIEDIIIRQKKMAGRPTLFLPGFDHASIAVEYLVNKELKKEGKSKKDVGREEFIKRAKEFTKKSRQKIKHQLKKLGFGLDWTREIYTLDAKRKKAVKEAFNRLYKKGLIYQGEYIVNWCPGCKTAISDLENEYKEKKGKLYYIKYGKITIATTRPETIFADTAIAVHPLDKRYKKLINTLMPLPLSKRKIPIIANKLVDPKFGTGALKITPAHDQLDFEIGRQHGLDALKAIDEQGNLTNICGKYAGLNREEAREKVAADLKKRGFLVKEEEYKHNVGHCGRCNTITESLISKQWFVKTKPMAEKALQAVKQGKIKIIPKRFEKIYFFWLKNNRDWCISRQLWWGHKIPLKGVEDSLDTWFSSSLWPIAAFGWPEQTKDLQYFYPISLRETGYDILTFWVIKEIMMCLEMTGKVPFKTIYLHGLVRDEKGRKFSKTAGIGFDPLYMTEKYGTDALRMALIVGNRPGNDLKLGEEKIKGYRNFINKIWNASRFVLINLEDYKPRKAVALSAEEKNILDNFDKFSEEINSLMEKFHFYRAAEKLYHYFWHVFADKIIEQSKARLYSDNKKNRLKTQYFLLELLKKNLIMLHPFIPFVTEEIYRQLPIKNKKKSILLEKWPVPDKK